MKRKNLLIGIIVIIVLIGAALAYFSQRNRALSPPGHEAITVGDLTIMVDYSRPSVRNRLIFGTEEQKALVPHGKYWRLGANEATEISFNKDVLFNGELVKAGTYSMYAIPSANSFEIHLNSEVGKWGVFEPDSANDILKTTAPVQSGQPAVEQFTILLSPTSEGATLQFSWSDVRVALPIRPQ